MSKFSDFLDELNRCIDRAEKTFTRSPEENQDIPVSLAGTPYELYHLVPWSPVLHTAVQRPYTISAWEDDTHYDPGDEELDILAMKISKSPDKKFFFLTDRDCVLDDDYFDAQEKWEGEVREYDPKDEEGTSLPWELEELAEHIKGVISVTTDASGKRVYSAEWGNDILIPGFAALLNHERTCFHCPLLKAEWFSEPECTEGHPFDRRTMRPADPCPRQLETYDEEENS